MLPTPSIIVNRHPRFPQQHHHIFEDITLEDIESPTPSEPPL
ncbi:hypothetical protein A2U01_0104257, partial [Trifolium medium]|nr:hypothetical protein [Trifolium medium]